LVASGGASTIHGHTLIVFTFVVLFLTTVIFISVSTNGEIAWNGRIPEISGGTYLVASGGASTIHGHTLIVFTLEVLFLTTVIFISVSTQDVLRLTVLRRPHRPPTNG
jgi:hypothetical protein